MGVLSAPSADRVFRGPHSCELRSDRPPRPRIRRGPEPSSPLASGPSRQLRRPGWWGRCPGNLAEPTGAYSPGCASALHEPYPLHPVIRDRQPGDPAPLIAQEGDDASVGGFLHVDELIPHGCVEWLPPPAVHAQPEPPVANYQPIGRRELITLVAAGVFLELIPGRLDQVGRLEIESPPV